MNENRLLCLGFGYAAQKFANRLAARDWTISGTTRDPAKADKMRRSGVAALALGSGEAVSGELKKAKAILVSTPPGPDGCPALAAAGPVLVEHKARPQWIGYLSTSGVYGDCGGAWVDETSPLNPSNARSELRMSAENEWRQLGARIGAPVVIFRLAAIYGPGRSALDAVRAGTAQRIIKPGLVFNRIHVDDIAAALDASLGNPGAGELFNLADDEPAPPQDVVDYACGLIGVTPPPLTPFENAALSEMAKSFYADSKRVSNRRLKEKLSPQFSFPTYREGLTAIFNAERRYSAPPESSS